MENTRENTPFRKLLRLVLFDQGSETGFTQSLKKQTRKALLHKPMFLKLGGPANSTWPAHQGSGLALTLNSERKMAIYYIPCPLHYGGCRSLARKKGELWLLGLLQTRQMASCFWFRSLPCGAARNIPVFSVCLCYLSTTPSPPPLEHVLKTS